MLYLERAVTRLKESPTGLSLYNELDAAKETIVIRAGDLPETREGLILGETKPKGDVRTNKFEGATVTVDPKNIEKNAVQWRRESPKDAAAITVAHELGHVKAAKQNLKEYIKEAKAGRSTYERQALPYESAVRDELKKLEEQQKVLEENR